MYEDNPFGGLIPGSGGGMSLPTVTKPPPSQTADQATKDALDVVRTQQLIREGELGAAAKPDKIPPAAVAGIQENIKALREVDSALQSLQTRPASIGPGTGMLGKYYTQWNDPKGTQVRADIGAIGAVKIHDLSGAAVSATEAPRFTPFVPATDDTPEAAKVKLEKFRHELDATVREALEFYRPENGYLPYSTPTIEEFIKSSPPPPPTPSQVEPTTPLPVTGPSLGPGGQTSGMVNVGDLGEPPREPGPVEPSGSFVDPATGELTLVGGSVRPEPTPDVPERLPKPMNPLTTSFLKGAGNVVEGVGNIPGLIANPIAAGVNYLAGREVMGVPDYGAQLRNAVGLPGDESTLGRVLEAGSSALTPALAAETLLAKAPGILSPTARSVTNVLAEAPIRQTTAGIGGATSGEAARAAGAPLPVQIAANVLGSVVGYGKAPPLSPRGRAPELAAASRAEGVPISKPMFDPRTREAVGNLESSPGSSTRIREGLQDTQAGVERRVGEIGGPGTVLETPEAGTIVQGAAQRFIARSRQTANRLYDRARALAGPNATVTPREGLSALRRELMDLRGAKNVNKGEIDFINEIGADLTEGPLTVDSIRAIRQGVRGRIDEKNLTSTQAEARAHRILDALQRDVVDSLPTAAGTAFRRADTYYRERMTHIDDILANFISPNKAGVATLSGEQAFNKLKSMANPKTGDARRMGAMWRNMEAGEQDDVVATIMQAIGRKDADSPFSTDRFLTQVANISPAARRTMFGERGAQSIDNLILLSNRLKDARGEINITKSGKVVKMGWGKPIAALLSGGTIGAIGGTTSSATVAATALAASLTGAGIRNLQARTLMNPAVSMWLADLPNANTSRQMAEQLARLGTIIARNPELKEELGQLKKQLTGAVGVQPIDNKLTPEATR